jgi:DNA-binding XRE family transcriptional regulator
LYKKTNNTNINNKNATYSNIATYRLLKVIFQYYKILLVITMKLEEIYKNNDDFKPMLLNELIGIKLRNIRNELNLSQEEFAEKVGLHRTYIGQVERAEKNITLKNIHKICYALKIDPKELFDFTDIL